MMFDMEKSYRESNSLSGHIWDFIGVFPDMPSNFAAFPEALP